MAGQEISHVPKTGNVKPSHDDVDSASCTSRLISSYDPHNVCNQSESEILTPASISVDPLEISEDSRLSGSTEDPKPKSYLEKSITAPTINQLPPTRHPKLWKTVALTAGFLFLALFSALGHYLLAHDLNGKPVDAAYLTQPQVSAVSILLTTIFKASVTATMGICFAQHLWYLLRRNTMPLSAVERLFVIRSDIVAFTDPRGIWKAPLLVLIAVLIWCLKIAMIYPPGALSVTLEPHKFIEARNMSVMNTVNRGNVSVEEYSSIPGLAVLSTFVLEERVGLAAYLQPKSTLSNIAQAVLVNGQIFTLPSQTGENSTYQLRFTAPQFRCNTQTYNTSQVLQSEELQYAPDVYNITANIFDAAWDTSSLVYSVETKKLSNFTAQRSSSGKTVWKALAQTVKQVCESTSVSFTVNMSFPSGIQRVAYSSNSPQLLRHKLNIAYDRDMVLLQDLYKQWLESNMTGPEFFTLANEWALLDALGTKLGDSASRYHHIGLADECAQSIKSTDNSTFWDCGESLYNSPSPANSNKLRGTAFDTSRFDAQKKTYDPRADLDLTEVMLNQILANVTISAISLGTWWDNIPVTLVRYRRLYRFSDPLNLIVPYTLCFAAAIVFAAMATWSLLQNGVPAADGGFLQIMLATRGNTEMNRRVLEEGATTVEDISDELKSLEVRYGELLGEGEGVKRGFGTVEETASLRKRR